MPVSNQRKNIVVAGFGWFQDDEYHEDEDHKTEASKFHLLHFWRPCSCKTNEWNFIWPVGSIYESVFIYHVASN